VAAVALVVALDAVVDVEVDHQPLDVATTVGKAIKVVAAAILIIHSAKYASNMVTLQISVGTGTMRSIGSTAAAATSSYTVDMNWYADSSVTDHITSELDKLAVRDKYHGTEKVHTANSAGMEISHVGKSFIHTPA
jgi:hypothetical protein